MEFKDTTIDLTEIASELVPTEGIIIDSFNSMQENLFLIDRAAPSPDEKEVVESIPFMNGSYDFSMIFGERFFEDRELTYQFMLFNLPYRERKVFETKLKRKLLPIGITEIYDTHDKDYFWLGKVTRIDVKDNEEMHCLEIEIIIKAHAYMFRKILEGQDVWDEFRFDSDVSQDVKFHLTSEFKDILLINVGQTGLVPKITVEGNATVEFHNRIYQLNTGQIKDDRFSLSVGLNELKIKGFGTIEFEFRRKEFG